MKQQHESDLNNPKERFPWAFRGLDYNGFPLAIPDPILEEWSEHLSKCGFIHVSQVERLAGMFPDVVDLIDQLPKQEIHYQPPVRGQDHTMNLSGSWVPVDTQIHEPVVSTLSKLTPAEQVKLLKEFKDRGLLDYS